MNFISYADQVDSTESKSRECFNKAALALRATALQITEFLRLPDAPGLSPKLLRWRRCM